ncbi:MAG: hypothetical protein HUJ97_08540, partial [Bacteroidales bacterium]|nr:hypothetical protein [Bacteroidales bacterium]
GIGMNDTGSVVTEKTAEQFKSGEVAWLLNGGTAGESPAWRQTLGTDNYPGLDVASGIVVKTTPTSLNSIIRPTAGTIDNATAVYNFAGIKDTDVYGIEYTGTLAANHPYIFKTDKDYVSFVPSEENITDDTETFGLTGVSDEAGKMVYGKNNTADADVSIVFTASALKYANQNGNLVKYGKCYIDATKCFIPTIAPAMSRSIGNFSEGGTTSINKIDDTDDESEAKTYNLQGAEVGKNYKGIVIYKGKKMVRN